MTDYHRMEWQYRVNVIATWARWIALFLVINEVMIAIHYHWPLWDDIAMPVTAAIHFIAGFVQKHTAIYRETVDGPIV